MDRDRHEGRPAPGTSFVQRIREARRIAQPPEFSPSPTDPPYRLISIFPSLLLARTEITPNQITIFWALLGLVAVVALGSSSYALQVSGAMLLQVSYLFDYVDGEVARLQNRSSKKGFFYDLAGHGLIKAALFLAIGYQVYRALEDPRVLLLAFSACVSISNGHALPFYAAHASVGSQPLSAGGAARLTEIGFLKRLFTAANLLFESPGLYGAVLLGAILGLLKWAVVFYGLVGPLWFLYRLRKFRYE